MTDTKFYSRVSDHALVLELWGASTKHPDCVFTYTKEMRRQEQCFQARWTQDYKWILRCASDMLWVGTAVELSQLALAMYKQCMEVERKPEKETAFEYIDNWN